MSTYLTVPMATPGDLPICHVRFPFAALALTKKRADERAARMVLGKNLK